MHSVDIIVPLYNNEDVIKECIDSLLRQINVTGKIIIIDNDSSDNSREVVDSIENTRIHLLFEKVPGAAAARNRGLDHASARYICFIDADVILPDEQWLERSIQLLENKLSENVVGVGGLGRSMETTGISAALDILLYGSSSKDTYTNKLATMDLVMRRDDIGELRFNTRLMRAQDPEFCFHFSDRGNVFYLSHDLSVIHKHPASMKALLKRWYRYGLYYRLPYTLHPRQKDLGYKGRIFASFGASLLTLAGFIRPLLLLTPLYLFSLLWIAYVCILLKKTNIAMVPFYATVHTIKQLAQLLGILVSYFGGKINRK